MIAGDDGGESSALRSHAGEVMGVIPEAARPGLGRAGMALGAFGRGLRRGAARQQQVADDVEGRDARDHAQELRDEAQRAAADVEHGARHGGDDVDGPAGMGDADRALKSACSCRRGCAAGSSLPAPEAPASTSASPASTWKLTLSKTGRRAPPWLCRVKVLATFST